jgi:hypothetical protein
MTCCGYGVEKLRDMFKEPGVPCASKNRPQSPLTYLKVQDAMNMKYRGVRVQEHRHLLAVRFGVALSFKTYTPLRR